MFFVMYLKITDQCAMYGSTNEPNNQDYSL